MATSISGVAAINLFNLGALISGDVGCWQFAAVFSVWMPVLALNVWLCSECIASLSDDYSNALNQSTSEFIVAGSV
jgi:hypothetical protein